MQGRDLVPSDLEDVRRTYAADWTYEFYDEARIIEFLKEEFGEIHLRTYDRLQNRAHKADFFRYCVLFAKGGLWLDIKTQLLCPLSEVFDRTTGVWYTSINAWNGMNPTSLNQALIASPAGNPVLRGAIDMIIQTPNAEFDNKDDPDKYLSLIHI